MNEAMSEVASKVASEVTNENEVSVLEGVRIWRALN
jgi:hypothetical protein